MMLPNNSNMVGTSTTENTPNTNPPTNAGTTEFNNVNNQWGWQPPRRGFCPAPRRGMYVRGGYMFPGPRGYVMPPQQQFQRKPCPWNPRAPRVPHFPVTPVKPFIPYQQPPWPNAQQMGPQRSDDETSESPQPKKKKKLATRPWDREAAEKALALELKTQKNAGANAIVIRFPDPEISKEIVQKFHPSIDNVHFQAPCSGRYCFVTLKEESNVDKVMSEISKIKFGNGHLQAERKAPKTEENVGPEDIDPFTLYVGNLPTNISAVEVKEKFPTATRIDVGYAQKMKFTRYAFARYSTAEAAFEAYKSSVNTVIASRSIILRFRRNKAPVAPPGETPAPSIIKAKPGETLTVGAKLKAKKEKAKAEKAAREKEASKNKDKKKKENKEDGGGGDDESSDDEEVELENDESDSDNDDDDDDDEDDDEPDDEDDDDDDDDEEPDDEYDDDDDDDDERENNKNYGDDDDEDDDDLEANIHDDDDDYMDDEDYKDISLF